MQMIEFGTFSEHKSKILREIVTMTRDFVDGKYRKTELRFSPNQCTFKPTVSCLLGKQELTSAHAAVLESGKPGDCVSETNP